MTLFTEHGHLEDTHHTYAYRKRAFDDYKPPEIGLPWNTSSHSVSLYKGGKRKACEGFKEESVISLVQQTETEREHCCVVQRWIRPWRWRVCKRPWEIQLKNSSWWTWYTCVCVCVDVLRWTRLFRTDTIWDTAWLNIIHIPSLIGSRKIAL